MQSFSLSRRIRWSLRSLLLSVLLCAVLLRAWLSYIDRYRVQRRAADALIKIGAFVETRPSGPKWIRAVVGDDKMVDVVRVELMLGDFMDSDLAHLRDLPRVYH